MMRESFGLSLDDFRGNRCSNASAMVACSAARRLFSSPKGRVPHKARA